MTARVALVIGHGQRADTELTRWLYGRLTACRYRAWADLQQLLGGDRFWGDIREITRNRIV